MKTSRFTDSQIIAILKQTDARTPVPDLCREHGMSSASFYRWRAKYGGMNAERMTRIRAGSRERTAEKMYAEERLKAEVLREAIEKVVRPSQRREMAASGSRASSDRALGCDTVGVSQTCYRYQAKGSAENEAIADWLIKLTHNQRNWGLV